MPERKEDIPKGFELNERQRRFVEAYLGAANGNGTEAASIAGYGGDRKSLAVISAQNLKKPLIRAAIENRTKDDGTVATREERQRFLTQIMRTEHRKLGERLKAVELLGRMHGDFIEKHTIDMTVGRKQQKEEIDHFLTQLKGRSDARILAAKNESGPIASVIEMGARAMSESILLGPADESANSKE